MNLPSAVQRPLKFPEKNEEGRCLSGLRREREIILGSGSGEVAFNFVLIRDF